MSTWTAADPRKTPISQQSDQLQRVQANVVQHHYVRAELHDINTRKGDALIKETIAALRSYYPQYQKWKDSKLEDLFDKITAHLQLSDLTINFEAPKWFMQPNYYDSYTQMYERAVQEIKPGAKEMRLANTGKNPPLVRAFADDKATFRADMARFHEDDEVAMKRGAEFNPEFEGLGRVMSPGGLKENLKVGRGEYIAKNKYFNPKSKQVFAALNYGERLHGSSVAYGYSYLVLNHRFKTNAVYLAGDTFDAVYLKRPVSADHQVSYRFLAGILGKTAPSSYLRRDLFKSCVLDQKLGDTGEGELLLEAHLFEPLTFTGNLQAIYISAKDGPQGGSVAIQTNARAFANKHGAKLYFIQ